MKKIILLLMLGVWWVAVPVSAQSYFNNRSTNNAYFNHYSSVIESGNKYYCTGGAFDSSIVLQITNPYYNPGLAFTVINKDGTTLSRTFFQLPYKALGPWSNNLRRLNDGSFIVAAYEVDTSSTFHQLIVDYDSVGQVIWYKEYDKTLCTGNPHDFWRLEDFQPTGTGEWLMLATLACNQSNNETDYSLLKLDSSFNVIWEKSYGDPTKNNVGGKLLIDGNSYIMAGGYNTYNVLPNTTTYKAEIFKLDTAGNVLNHVLINNPNRTNTIRDIIKTQDGNYAYCGAGDGYEDPPNPFFATVNFRGWIQKVDTAFNPIWSRSFNQWYYATEFKKIIEKPNGDLLVWGDKYEPVIRSSSDYDLHVKGWYVRLKANGDSLAERKYSAISSCDDQNSIYDVKQTSDGGFIIAGESTDRCATGTNPSQRAWLIKVDSNGCSSANDPQCWAVAVPHNPRTTTSEYKVYPNPVTDQLSISYTNTSGSGAAIHIIDMVGRKIVESPLPGKTGTANIDVRNLQSGIYQYRILENGRSITQGRILKN